MRRRDEVDILAALVDQPLKRGAQPGRGERLPEILLRDHPVLAECAAQRTPGEEDCPAAVAAGNDRLLPVMQRGARGMDLIRHPAEAELPRRAVNAAAARTEGAMTIIQHKCLPKQL